MLHKAAAVGVEFLIFMYFFMSLITFFFFFCYPLMSFRFQEGIKRWLKSSFITLSGVLVNAMRNGHWIILDELNLAPTDVLEALNRLLDDNRELFIPETQETIKAHPNFMLFATQNPPGLYGGRKVCILELMLLI